MAHKQSVTLHIQELWPLRIVTPEQIPVYNKTSHRIQQHHCQHRVFQSKQLCVQTS